MKPARRIAAALGVLACAAGFWLWKRHGNEPRLAATRLAFEPQPRSVLAALGIDESSQPELAFTTNDTLYLLAGAGDADRRKLVLSYSSDGGDSFAAPVDISPPGAVVMTHGEMGPELRAKGEGVYALWQQRAAPPNDKGAAQIVLARSTNSGRSFGAPVPVTDKAAGDASFSGFANLGISPGGELYAVWLDGRNARRAPGTFEVYLAKSTDRGATWSANARVAEGSCPCCRPAVAADGQGNVYVAWRKVYSGDQRDLALSVSRDGGKSFAAPLRVAADHWTLHACPESGPAIALRDGSVVVAWYSGAGTPGVRVATSEDGARTFRVAAVGQQVVDQNHPSLALSEDGRLWLGLQGRRGGSGNPWPPLESFVVQVGADGRLSEASAAGLTISGYPALAAAAGGRVFLAGAQEQMGRDTVLLERARVR